MGCLRAGDSLAAVAPHRQRADNTRAIPLEDLEELWRRRSVPLREKTLWRMLYETAARTSEVPALNVEDLDRARRKAPDPLQGGNTHMVVLAAPTARLLGRYLTDRTHGPVFLTRWRTRTEPDGRVRLWGEVTHPTETTPRFLRVVTLENGETIHNAFFDRRFRKDDP